MCFTRLEIFSFQRRNPRRKSKKNHRGVVQLLSNGHRLSTAFADISQRLVQCCLGNPKLSSCYRAYIGISHRGTLGPGYIQLCPESIKGIINQGGSWRSEGVIPSRSLTKFAPEKLPKPNRKGYSMLNFRGVTKNVWQVD